MKLKTSRSTRRTVLHRKVLSITPNSNQPQVAHTLLKECCDGFRKAAPTKLRRRLGKKKGGILKKSTFRLF